MRVGRRKAGAESRQLTPVTLLHRLPGGAAGALAVALCLLPGTLAPQPAWAFQLFGYRFFESAPQPDSPDAQPYKIEMHVPGGDKTLRSALEDATSLYRDRDEPAPPSTPAFLSKARADYMGIQAALYVNARYGGSSRIMVNGRNIDDIPNETELPRPVNVVITVDPGPAFTFGSITMQGRAPPTALDEIPKTKTPERLGFVTGEPARSDVILGAEQALVDGWRRLGYPKAKVLPRIVTADHATQRLNVVIGVDPGRKAHYGSMNVTGTRDMDPDFVARQTGLKPGDVYDPAEIALARQRLQHLQVFSTTTISEATLISADGTLPLTITVAERPLHVFGGGASYSTTEGIGLNGYWEHRNLFGQAERLRIEASTTGATSVDPNDLTFSGGVTFVKPGVFTPFTDFTAQLLARREVYDPYSQNTYRARAGFSHRFSEQFSGLVALNGEYDQASDGFGRRNLLVFSVPGQLTYDTSDDKLQPTRGIRLKASFEPLYEHKFHNAALSTRLDGSGYFSLDTGGRYVLAARAAAGSIAGAPARELPSDRLFFAGGGGSVRGFNYRSLGFRLENGEIVGGRSLVEGSLEMRLKVTQSIGIVPFVDAGGAFARSYPDFSEKVRVGAGVGVRYYTSLGAIRADIARATDIQPGDPAVAFYLGLGESF